MTDKRKAAPGQEAANQDALVKQAHDTTGQPVKDTQIARVLALLIAGTLNRFEANPHGDTCLNSTISSLRNRHKLTILDRWETYSGRHGSKPVKRYWIPEGEPMELALKLLAHMRAREAARAARKVAKKVKVAEKKV